MVGEGRRRGRDEGRVDIRAHLILQRGVNLDSILVVCTKKSLANDITLKLHHNDITHYNDITMMQANNSQGDSNLTAAVLRREKESRYWYSLCFLFLQMMTRSLKMRSVRRWRFLKLGRELRSPPTSLTTTRPMNFLWGVASL